MMEGKCDGETIGDGEWRRSDGSDEESMGTMENDIKGNSHSGI